ncbi:hypothetical protein BDV40DRAFT_168881 [Aspergillus tamarii]|uniref:Uncharacterized protein n=1 Tax=Aspergillus tamarii TaxID=41984 RepID=A0A5N6V8Z8_ASPTM|nr:hypothetical protein BDV40DRAFT_168881 [Aspergillus tamarii]
MQFRKGARYARPPILAPAVNIMILIYCLITIHPPTVDVLRSCRPEWWSSDNLADQRAEFDYAEAGEEGL